MIKGENGLDRIVKVAIAAMMCIALCFSLAGCGVKKADMEKVAIGLMEINTEEERQDYLNKFGKYFSSTALLKVQDLYITTLDVAVPELTTYKFIETDDGDCIYYGYRDNEIGYDPDIMIDFDLEKGIIKNYDILYLYGYYPNY